MFGKQKQMGRWIAIAVATGLVWASHVSAQKPPKPPQDEPLTYKMVQLSSDRGPANAINELADGVVEVVGTIQDSSGESEISRAHYWMVDRAGDVLPINLKTLPHEEPEATVHSDALDVNNHGVVVGSQWDETWQPRPLLWPSGADAPIALPLPDGAVGAYASSINDEGIVVGAAFMDVRKLVAWKVALVDEVWIVQDSLVILSEPGLSVWHLPQIANGGYVGLTLYSAGVDGSQRAFRLKLGWDENEMLLGVLDPMTPLFDCFSTAYGINEAGTICGRYAPAGEQPEAYVMTVSAELLNLAVIPAMKKKGIDYSATHNLDAMGLNNLDAVQIVGWGSRRITQGNYQGGEAVPLRWDGETRVTDLRTVTDGSPPYLYEGTNINDAGWITASTRNQAWEFFPVLLIPSK